MFFSPQISSWLPDLSDEVSGGHGGQGSRERSGHPTEQRRILLTSGRETWTSTVWWCPVSTEGYVHSLVSSFLKTQLASHRQQEPGCKNTRFGLKNRDNTIFYSKLKLNCKLGNQCRYYDINSKLRQKYY